MGQPCLAGDQDSSPKGLLTRSYTLQSALTRALTANKSIRAAEADSSAATAGVGRSLGPLLPQAYASMNVRKLSNLRDETWHTDYLDQASNTRRIGVQQTLFDMPALNRYQGADLEEDRANLYLKSTQLDIIRNTETEYFSLLSAKENVKSYKKAVERMERQVESAMAFYERQMKPRLHVLQMKTQLAKANTLLTEARNQVKSQRANLLSILSHPQSGDITFAGILNKTKTIKLGDLSAYLETAAAKRPDALIRKKNVEIAEKQADVVRSEFLPTISATADYTQDDIDYDSQSVRNKNHEYYTVGVNVNWNFFSGMGTYYGTKQQEKLTESAQLSYEKVLEDIAAQVRNSYETTIQFRKQIAMAKTYVTEAQETYDRADKAYRLGIGTSTDLLDASNTLVDAEVSLNMAYADYNKGLVTLYYQCGSKEDLMLLSQSIPNQ